MTKPHKKINIEIYSFGFKYYQKVEAPNFDLRFDLRNKMKNPQSHLPKGAIGKDKVVIDTILKSDQNKKLIKRIDERIKLKVKDEFNIKKFKIGFGCRSGIHRSVVLADYFYEILIQRGYKTTVNHINLRIDK